MECIRFGGTIPGEYWGCCGGDIFQNFNQHPDTPASIQLVEGDSGYPLTNDREAVYLGPTLRDIFWQRLRVSTFGTNEMPNHFFLAVLEHSQMQGEIGKQWLALLKEAGFEFIRTTDNSVYTGDDNDYDDCYEDGCSAHKNHIFGLFRNIGQGGKIDDPFTPPKEWTGLPSVAPEQWDFNKKWGEDLKGFVVEQREAHRKIWEAHGPTKFMTEAELVKAGVPVIVAGLRTEFPPELKETREQKLAARKVKGCPNTPSQGTQYLYKHHAVPKTPVIAVAATPQKG